MVLQSRDDGGLRELALFAGAGGGILGGRLLGWRTVCAVELNPYAREVLAARQNDGCLEPFPVWDDVRTFDGKPWRGRVDVVSGGFPCQDICSCGPRTGIRGKKSGLWSEMLRIIIEVGPSVVLVENSSELIYRGLGVILGDLAEIGFDAKWACISAAHAGAPQWRDRIWIVAHPYCGGLAPGDQWHTTKSRIARWNHADGLGAAQDRASSGEAVFRGMDDVVAGRLDRLVASGNGQVPAVVRLAWETLKP